MRRNLFRAVAVTLALLPVLPAAAQDGPLIPERRLVLTEGSDFYGADIASIFDTTLQGCETACLADSTCQAFTFNRRSNSCFPKTAVSDVKPYQGAVSGWVYRAAEGAAARAAERAKSVSFLADQDFTMAFAQATDLANRHVTGDAAAEDLLAAAARARAAGDQVTAVNAQGAALNLTDAADQWVAYSADLAALASGPLVDSDSDRRALRDRAASAALNGYLRAEGKPLRVTALMSLAEALQAVDRGRQMIPVLRLAQSITPRDDTAAMLDDAIGKYGFRIGEHQVEADTARPRICAVFTEDLVRSGVDYATYVQLPEPGLAVDASGRQICVSGITHGSRYTLTFREGLPAADGQELAKDIAITAYVRDRSPGVRFPGRAYVLPRLSDSGLPVEAVNTRVLDLTLSRVSDRNLIRAIQNDYFARPLDYYESQYLDGEVAEELWSGSADVAMEVNRDVTTRLPITERTGPLVPGVYVLSASVPGLDPYDNPPATQWFLVSDLGITSLQGVDGIHVFVRSLADAGPKPGVTLALVSQANAVLGTATTDAEGHAQFPAGLTLGRRGAEPALLTAVEAEADFAFLPLTDPEFDLSDRGVAGHPPAPPIDLFLTTDRGAYRAGETIHVTALARNAEAGAIEGLPVTLRLFRPDGVEYSRVLATQAGAGGHVAALPVGGAAPRGTWRVEAYADPDAPPLAAARILVEDFLPERIDFTLGLPDAVLPLTDLPMLGVDARYLFGAPGADLAVEGDIRFAAASAVPGFDGFRFGRYDAPFESYFDTLPETRTDADGQAGIGLSAPQMGEVTRPLTARITVRVAEGSGRPVERRVERTVMPDGRVIGIRPRFDGGVLPDGGTAGFDLVALGPDAKPRAAQLHWRIDRVETDYQWYLLYGQWNWEPVTTRSRIAEGDLTLDQTGPQTVAADVEAGQYEIVVETVDGSYADASMDFSAGWYMAEGENDAPDMLDLALDKPAYRPGDIAHLRVTPRAPGVALVSILSNHVIATKVVDLAGGETVIDLPVTEAWGGGAYVTVSAIRPLAGPETHAPVRALGLAHATVDPGRRRLSAQIEAAAEVDPRGPLPVAVKVDGVVEGETAYVTLAAVDLGILNLTAFTPPDPLDHYFGQRRLGVAIRDLYGRLIDGHAGVPGSLRSGGDEAAGLKMKAPPPTEELVAYFAGPLTVGADGYARTEFGLPSFNGTVRLMAVVWSQTGIGQANADVLVRDPVVVTASVPRFLAPGDQSRLLLEIVHASGPSGRMGLDVTAAGVDLGAAPSGVDLAEQGKAVVSVPISAGSGEGVADLHVTLTTPAGRVLTKNLRLPVQVNDPEIARQSRFTLAAGKEFTLDRAVFAGLVPGSGRATLAVGPVARFDAPGLLAALDAYPYGCTEQLTSKALPLLYFGQIAQAMGLETAGDIGQRIDEAVAEILLNQSAGGAFGLWQPDSGDLWLDAYVSDFLSRARQTGHPVPDTAFRSALDNLRNQVNYAPDFDSGGGDIAYALMVLAREGAAAVGDLRYYADVKADAFDTPLAAAQLGAALAAYGDQTRADAMFTRAARLMAARLATAEAKVWRADYGSDLRDATAILALSAESGSNAVPADRLGEAVASTIAGRRLSTQEATWALMATHALIDRPGAEGFRIDGVPATGPVVRLLADDGAGPGATVVTNGTDREATVTLTTYGVPSEPEPATGNGYTITRSYYTLDGEPADIGRLTQGDRLVALLEVTPHGGGEARLMVDDPLPAGFEIDNPSLLRGGDIAALDWLDTVEDARMTEFRQDRFLAAVDTDGGTFRLAYILRAISPGSFHHPAASVEDMYRPEFRARTDAGQVTIAE